MQEGVNHLPNLLPAREGTARGTRDTRTGFYPDLGFFRLKQPGRSNKVTKVVPCWAPTLCATSQTPGCPSGPILGSPTARGGQVWVGNTRGVQSSSWRARGN